MKCKIFMLCGLFKTMKLFSLINQFNAECTQISASSSLTNNIDRQFITNRRLVWNKITYNQISSNKSSICLWVSARIKVQINSRVLHPSKNTHLVVPVIQDIRCNINKFRYRPKGSKMADTGDRNYSKIIGLAVIGTTLLISVKHNK